MPKHCSGIGINLFVQSKERNLFINVYFGAGIMHCPLLTEDVLNNITIYSIGYDTSI
jgi:4-hydroxyphenylpyruvate dioxygenase-like putative hemolysin